MHGCFCYNRSMHLFLLFLLCAAILIFSVFTVEYAMRCDLQKSEYSVRCPDLPLAFDGLSILHLSDLHGKNPVGLLEAAKESRPDLIFITGDFYDGVQNASTTENILHELQTIAPVYLVGGNHEYYARNWSKRAAALGRQGIHVVENRVEVIEKNGSSIEIAGLRDPDLDWRWSAAKRLSVLEEDLENLPAKKSFRLLLFHRADLFDQTASAKASVTFSGHLHGGHWRLFGKGLLAPSDGDRIHFFPKYDAGLFYTPHGILVVSRGLGDQMKIPRLFNRPQILVIRLRKT